MRESIYFTISAPILLNQKDPISYNHGGHSNNLTICKMPLQARMSPSTILAVEPRPIWRAGQGSYFLEQSLDCTYR